MNQATMTLTVKADGSDKIVKQAACPIHKNLSSDYLGVLDEDGQDVWAFRCKATPEHNRHVFYAKPAKDAPKTHEQVDAWLNSKRQSRISSKEVRKRGA